MPLERKIQAVIFDMDGVISDTQVIHSSTESEMLKTYGIEMDPDEITRRYAGVEGKIMFPVIFKDAKKEMPPLDELLRRKWEMVDKIVKVSIKEIPGTREFIEQLKKYKVPIAVASASRLSFIKKVLSELNLTDKFDAISSSEEVEYGKPEPDIFLLSAKRLSVAPENCLVIEDGINGMIAAKRAGMQCIGLVINQNYKAEDYPADLLTEDLQDVPIEEFISRKI